MEESERESSTAPVNLEIIIRPEAEAEVREAFYYYEDKNEGLGFEFMRSLDAALHFVRRNPFGYQTIYRNTRRVLIRKFPYALFYVVEEKRIVVIACFHQRRHIDERLR